MWEGSKYPTHKINIKAILSDTTLFEIITNSLLENRIPAESVLQKGVRKHITNLRRSIAQLKGCR